MAFVLNTTLEKLEKGGCHSERPKRVARRFRDVNGRNPVHIPDLETRNQLNAFNVDHLLLGNGAESHDIHNRREV